MTHPSVLTRTRHVLDTRTVIHAVRRDVSIQQQGRTLFIQAFANAINVPESEIRLRIRSVSEAGLLQKGVEPFLPQHGVRVLLAFMASPTHAEAGRIVPRFAALRRSVIGRPKDRGDSQMETAKVILKALPVIEKGTLEDVLTTILADLNSEKPLDYRVTEFETMQPPHDMATIRFVPTTGSLPEIAVTFGGQHPRGLSKAAPRREVEVIVRIPGRVLTRMKGAIKLGSVTNVWREREEIGVEPTWGEPTVAPEHERSKD